MKAIRVALPGEPAVMKLEDVPDPVAGPGQVVVKVAAAGVNPVETYIRAGKYPLKVPFPYTPGHDAAGTVASIGPGVDNVKIGDRVYTSVSLSGTYASMTLCPSSGVHPLPRHVTFEQGAAVGVPYATAWRAVHTRGDGKPGQWLLIHGASGGVGSAATQIAAAWGMRIIGTAGTEKGRKLVEQNGADHVLDHSSPGYLDRIMELTGGKGVDLIVEFVANVNLNKDLGVLAPRGRVVVVGSRGPVEIDPRQTMTKDTSVLGMSMWNATPEEVREIHSAIGAGLTNRTFTPVIGKEFKLADAPKAHEAVMAPGSYGKIVLIP